MESLKVINQNKYFTVIEFLGDRYINVKKQGVSSIQIDGQTFYKIASIGNQSSMQILRCA